MTSCISARWLMMLILVAITTAVEVYEDVPDFDSANMILHNENEPEAGSLNHFRSPLDITNEELMFFELITMPHDGKIINSPYRSLNYDMETGYQFIPKKFNDGIKYRKMADKRDAIAGGARSVTQKWKTKKGKYIGSQMICYFKLCAFRAAP